MLAYLTALQLPEGLLVYAAGEDVRHDVRIEYTDKRIHVRTLDISLPPAQVIHEVRKLALLVRGIATTQLLAATVS
jgi:5-methylcytosine-specific restriction enzyme subunit McrC